MTIEESVFILLRIPMTLPRIDGHKENLYNKSLRGSCDGLGLGKVV